MRSTKFPNLPSLLSLTTLFMGACGASTESRQSTSPPSATRVTYDLHEWGLVRATLEDHVMLSGPHANIPMLALAKPVLYFHRVGEGALEVDVNVHIDGGRIVEHWPVDPTEGAPGSDIGWQVQLGEGTCSSPRYPNETNEQPCQRLSEAGDACEAATLRTVETTDATCVTWGAGTQQAPWNHLFYRAELQRDPMLPLIPEVGPSGSVRLRSRGADAITGSIVRVVLANGAPGVRDGAVVVRPPQPGETIDVPAPTAPIADAMAALDASLRDAGLTEQETAAFRRAWDATLFGLADASISAAEAGPPHATDSLLYVLPEPVAESLATLRLTPTPRELRRVIVAWVEVPTSH